MGLIIQAYVLYFILFYFFLSVTFDILIFVIFYFFIFAMDTTFSLPVFISCLSATIRFLLAKVFVFPHAIVYEIFYSNMRSLHAKFHICFLVSCLTKNLKKKKKGFCLN